MFEIGGSLREVRESRRLELSAVSAATRIRSSHLAALENENFDALPGRAYARAFLREYAEYLGLDGQRFVDEFDARYPEVAEPPIVPVGLPQAVRLRPYVTTTAWIAAVLLLGLLAWRSGDDERTTTSPPPAPIVPPRPPATPHAAPALTARPRPRAELVLNALGRCWLEAHVGSREGRTIFSGTLEPGEHVRLEAGRLWIRLGAPWNLSATLNGRPVSLPDRIANIVVTPRGVTTLAQPEPAL